jgi:hypothetical protein
MLIAIAGPLFRGVTGRRRVGVGSAAWTAILN